MRDEDIELWRRIAHFQIDSGRERLSFLARLARDNGWTLAYAGGALQEYKRFCFLAVSAGHPVTPSDEVDQVWHLHLLYTRSYWGEFCRKALQTELHHGPTEGGGAEREKFTDWYTRTLESYERAFGTAPPRAYWPTPGERMAGIRFERVDRDRFWVLRKWW